MSTFKCNEYIHIMNTYIQLLGMYVEFWVFKAFLVETICVNCMFLIFSNLEQKLNYGIPITDTQTPSRLKL